MMVNEEYANTPSLRDNPEQHHTLARLSDPDPVGYRARFGGKKAQSSWLLWIGFGGLLCLLALSGLHGLSTVKQIGIRTDAIRSQYFLRDRLLQELRSNLYTSGTLIRDLLLETDPVLSEQDRREFRHVEDVHSALAARYQQLLDAAERVSFNKVSDISGQYLSQLEPTLTWTEEERRTRGIPFSKDVLLPQRAKAIAEIDQLSLANAHQLENGSQQTVQLSAQLFRNLLISTTASLAIGLLLAVLTTERILRLERLEQEQVRQLQDLSSRLVQVQEEERRAIARELHDEIGQSVSGLLLGIGNVAATLPRRETGATLAQLGDLCHLAERTVASVRSLSLSLRPSMLDDLGLVPALQWLAREASRTSNIAVEIVAENPPEEDLPDAIKTCIYRIVQEALANVARHARATTVEVRISRHIHDGVTLVIEDDGRGFNPIEKGLGILGMEERVRHQSGTLQIKSEPNAGTTLLVHLPA